MVSNADLRITLCFGSCFVFVFLLFLVYLFKFYLFILIPEEGSNIFLLKIKPWQGMNLGSSTLMQNTTHSQKTVSVGSFSVKDVTQKHTTLFQGTSLTIGYVHNSPASPAILCPVVTHNL